MSAARAASQAAARRAGASAGESPALQFGANGQPLRSPRAARPALERSGARAASIAEAVSRWLDQEL